LKQLFKKHYLPAAEAFETKDFLKARDEWIRSLVFPVYQEDLKKHRGVVLTLLRPYINDALSKTGGMNVLLTENDFYAAEEKIRAAYENLSELLQKHSWEEAGARILEISKQLEGVKGEETKAPPPPFPQEISLVDSDIREVLLAQAEPAQPSALDWEGLRQDLAEKEKVIQGRSPAALDQIRKDYEEALGFIQNGNWREALTLLQKMDFPPELAEDARAKIVILNKLLETASAGSASPSLDSQEKTG
jgi:hypothetical protein